MADRNFILARHETPDRLFYAIIDETLRGTRWEEETAVLDFTAPFFHGDVVTPDELEALFAEEAVDMIIIAGNDAIHFFKEKGLITDEDTLTIAGIPYASILFEFDDEGAGEDAYADDEDAFDEDDSSFLP